MIAINTFMAKKKIGSWIDSGLSARLDKLVEDCGEQKGVLLSAALKMFLDSEPEVQGKYVASVAVSRISEYFSNLSTSNDLPSPKQVVEQVERNVKRKKARQSKKSDNQKRPA
jgi:hypothetical protein